MELITAIQNNPIVGLVVTFTRLIYSDFDNFLGGFLIEYWYGVVFLCIPKINPTKIVNSIGGYENE